MPTLASVVGAFVVNSNARLETIEIPALQSVGAEFEITKNTYLNAITSPLLTSIGALIITDNGSFSTCDAKAISKQRVDQLGRTEISGNAASETEYRDAGNGTVAFDICGSVSLLWQQVVDAGPFTWDEADAYCANLSLAGAGWRLPTKIELMSLVDLRGGSPTIDPVAFPDTPAEYFWSSTLGEDCGTCTINAGSPWVVSFADGSSSTGSPGGAPRVRCVR
jgi:hypothetical protein